MTKTKVPQFKAEVVVAGLTLSDGYITDLLNEAFGDLLCQVVSVKVTKLPDLEIDE